MSLGQRLISANNTPVSISYIGTNSKTAFTLPQTFSSVSLGSAGFVIVGVIGKKQEPSQEFQLVEMPVHYFMNPVLELDLSGTALHPVVLEM